jgi:hypothetical protein
MAGSSGTRAAETSCVIAHPHLLKARLTRRDGFVVEHSEVERSASQID